VFNVILYFEEFDKKENAFSLKKLIKIIYYVTKEKVSDLNCQQHMWCESLVTHSLGKKKYFVLTLVKMDSFAYISIKISAFGAGKAKFEGEHCCHWTITRWDLYQFFSGNSFINK